MAVREPKSSTAAVIDSTLKAKCSLWISEERIITPSANKRGLKLSMTRSEVDASPRCVPMLALASGQNAMAVRSRRNGTSHRTTSWRVVPEPCPNFDVPQKAATIPYIHRNPDRAANTFLFSPGGRENRHTVHAHARIPFCMLHTLTRSAEERGTCHLDSGRAEKSRT